jgi:S-adenosylmethionine:tRNA ribosyltransferase-isomerase
MPTSIDLYDYELPESFIAQRSVEPRDHAKLMVVDRTTGELTHQHFFDLPKFLKAGDVLVFNTSKVFKARLVDGGVEMFVLRISNDRAEVLLKPGKKFKLDSTVRLFNNSFVVESKQSDGVVVVRTYLSATDMLAFCDTHGSVPTPPYVKAEHQLDGDYQTVYAKEVGSVAAPTAGLHFTEELLDKLKAKGVQIEYVVLHVGIGTFRPVQVDTLEEHTMHSEWVSLSAEVAERINTAKSEGRRVIAVGTTTTRVLEGIATLHSDSLPPLSERGIKGASLRAYAGDVNMFIKPGYEFKVIDGLITNFHLPKSTLLVLVSALAGRENILAAYEEAKKHDYRFFSFGDGMMIL